MYEYQQGALDTFCSFYAVTNAICSLLLENQKVDVIVARIERSEIRGRTILHQTFLGVNQSPCPTRQAIA